MNLQREVLHVPVYAWLAGAGALLLSIVYFAKRGNPAKTAATGTTPMNASVPGSPANIYESTNVYNPVGAVPGSGQVTGPPIAPFSAVWARRRAPVPQTTSGAPVQPLPIPVRKRWPVAPLSDTGFGSGAMMPGTVDPVPWRPRMNSDIFGPPADGTSPVTPVIAWNMTPTAAYTQA